MDAATGHGVFMKVSTDDYGIEAGHDYLFYRFSFQKIRLASLVQWSLIRY